MIDAERTIDADIAHGPARLLRHASIADMRPHGRHHCIDGASLASQHLVLACNSNANTLRLPCDSQTFMQLQASNSGGSTSAESVRQHRCSNSAEQASERNIVATAANQQQQLTVLV